MAAISIQRLVEQQAAMRGDAIAVVDGERTLSYLELNQRANAVARHLSRSGLQRGFHTVVRLPRGPELAAVLLAVLKAGASYTWMDPSSTRDDGGACAWPVAVGRRVSDEPFAVVDLSTVLTVEVHPAPNLPILTRGSDIACVVPDSDGRAAVLVPHATVTSLAQSVRPPVALWNGDAGALDLWAGLMTGATVTVERPDRDTRAA